MEEMPRRQDDHIQSLRRPANLIANGTTMTVGTLGMSRHGEQERSRDNGLTLAFTSFVLFQVFDVLNARAEQGTCFNCRFFDNRLRWTSLGVVLTLKAPAIY